MLGWRADAVTSWRKGIAESLFIETTCSKESIRVNESNVLQISVEEYYTLVNIFNQHTLHLKWVSV